MVKKAYIILKNHAFSEKYNLFLKKTVAEFEVGKTHEFNINKKGFFEKDYSKLEVYFSKLADDLNKEKYYESEDFLKLVERIEIRELPKKYIDSNKLKDDRKQLNFFTNVKTQESYSPDGCNYIIDAPIELHIIDFLWSLLVGSNLDAELSEDVYGNRLTEEARDFEKKYGMEKSSNRIFKYYYSQYNKWRNLAIKSASDISRNNEDVAILVLDIKSFYYNLDIDFDNIPCNKYQSLNNTLKTIILNYNIKLENEDKKNIAKMSLPIGFSSSAIIANYSLKHFDEYVSREVRPSYYGRYVDDLLLVFKRPIIEDNKPTEEFINNYFKGCISHNYDINNKGSINKRNFNIQKEKIVLQYFNKDNSKAGLNFLRKELSSRTSLVNFSHSHLDDDLDNFSYKALYSDSEDEHLKNLVGLIENDSGFNNFINSHISAKKLCENRYSENIFEKIKFLFKGVNILKLSKYWEKVYEYLLVSNRKDEAREFYHLVWLETNLIDNSHMGVINSLQEYNNIAFEIANSINSHDVTYPNILDLASKFRISNMFNHKLVSWPLINYTDYDKVSLDTKEIISEGDLKLSKDKLDYSPRFIHFDEYQLFSFIDYLNSSAISSEESKLDLPKWLSNCRDNYPNTFALKSIEIKPPLLKTDSLQIDSIDISSEKTQGKLTVGIANLEVSETDILKNIKDGDKPNISVERFRKLNNILDEAKLQKCDLLVLPEVSIPVLWLPYLISYSRMNQVGIIFGLEHWVSNNIVYNFMVESLPFIEKNSIKQNIFTMRLKNHYAPKELGMINEMLLSTPYESRQINNLSYYHKVNWKGISLATYNCYELADISHRAIFKNEIDLLVASVFNADTNYYDHIMESVVRDLHCYVVQVNTSQYGGSCVLRPSKTELKKMLYLKGGENECILKSTIDISGLRDFQFGRTGNTSKTKNVFKGVPPGFDHMKARTRGKK